MATREVTKIDSGILQYVPKGAFYEGADEQFNRVSQMWEQLFSFDRTLFCLMTLLGGTGFSKGAMSHMLLNNPVKSGNLPVPEGLSFDYESRVILYNLYKESVPRALKNLLMLTGAEGFHPVNNARTRKLILEYIFNRSNHELDSLAINFKGKLKTLVRHALGKQDIAKILNGNVDLFFKWIGRYNSKAMPVVYHIFDRQFPITTDTVLAYYPLIEQYWKLRNAAKNQDVDEFRKLMKGMPQRTVMGFRNTYQLSIDISEIYDKAKTSDRESLQMESAAKRSGSKTFKVDYSKQQLYDLWKAFYHKVSENDSDNIDEIEKQINIKSEKLQKIDIGDCAVVIDASRSMYGSDQRPMHPFITALCVISSLQNIKDIFYVGGKIVQPPTKSAVNVLFPANSTPLWRGLLDAAKTNAKNIVVISDGYENEVKGMFEHSYNHLKNVGHKFNLVHINPVFAADAKTGSVRRLIKDVDPMPLADHKYLETEIIFKQMIENREMVKQLLVNKYKKLISA